MKNKPFDIPRKTYRNHYIPQFYLKHFSIDKNHIYMYQKSTQKHGMINIKNAAVGKKIYREITELVTSISESIQAPIHKKIVADIGSINLKEKATYALFIQSLMSRQSKKKYTMEKILEGFFQRLEKLGHDTSKGINIGEAHIPTPNDKETINNIMDAGIIEDALQYQEIATFLATCNWHTMEMGRGEVITSDSPIIQTKPFVYWDFQIIFPISKEKILIIDNISEASKNYRHIIQYDTRRSDKINELIIRKSTYFVYSNIYKKELLPLIKKYKDPGTVITIY